MRRISLLVLAAMATTVAVAVPALAADKKSTSEKCQPHAVSYVGRGTVVSAALTPDPATVKTYSGTLTVQVTQTNKHANADRTETKTYTLSLADVSFGADVNSTAPAVGSRVNLKGTISTLSPQCSRTGFTPTITITKVEIHRAKAPKA